MKAYLPSLVVYVPDDMVSCLGAFLDACYIARRQDINSSALDDFDRFVEKIRRLRETFRISGIRHKVFALPQQHSLFHYRRMIEDFGAPGGLCSSITESRHVTAVNRPYRRSSRYKALGQMLLINQRLDKLTAMSADFVERGMLPGRHQANSSTLQGPERLRMPADDDDDDEDKDERPVDEDILGHVLGGTPPPDEDQKRARKPRYSITDLPFPEDSSVYIIVWRKNYVPSLISWAGTLEDPFGTNCQMEDQVIKLWKEIFPNIHPLLKASLNLSVVLTLVRRLLLCFFYI